MSRNNSYSNSKEHSPIWDVKTLESFFKEQSLPGTIQLNVCSKIDNVESFIESHLEIIAANNGNPIFLPFYERLLQLKNVL